MFCTRCCCENLRRLRMSFHLLLEKLFCTRPTSLDWKCSTWPKSRLQRKEEEQEKGQTFRVLRRHWTSLTWRAATFHSVKDSHLFCASSPPSSRFPARGTSMCEWRFGAIFLCRGRGWVTEGRQYRLRGSQGVQSALTGLHGGLRARSMAKNFSDQTSFLC